jgi:predicted esterase
MIAALVSVSLAQEPPKKVLQLPGESFMLAGRPAFVIQGKVAEGAKSRPWVWYAPTLPGLPGNEEKWMFERFQDAGIAIAGIDAGESYGSPNGNKVFSALYEEMTKARGYSRKPVMLGRSRGGLMTLSWASHNPEKVGGFAGIYPVCNLESYPGFAKASGAFELTSEKLKSDLKQYNPIDRLEGMAKNHVPLFAIHGDIDKVVPLEFNSGLMKQRYEAIGGSMQLIVPAKQGHNMWPGFFQSQELVDFVKAHAGSAIVIEAPLEYQVCQRNKEGWGDIQVRVKLAAKPSKNAKIQTRPTMNGILGTWSDRETLLEGDVLSAKSGLAGGGWYRLEIRIVEGNKILAETSVDHFGVGEVFVVAGQSNSANHGSERQISRTKLVSTFDGKRWQIANDPIPGASGGGGSFMPPLGDVIAEYSHLPVGFIACGVGATSVREWLPKGSRFPNPPTLEGHVRRIDDQTWESRGDIYEMFIGRMKALGPNGFRGVLWHQGESDANQQDKTRTLEGRLYRECLEKLIRQSRKDIGFDVPWFVAQASYHIPGDDFSTEIRNAQASLWKDGIALEGPDTDALKGPFRENNGQGVHFNGRGLREHAGRWFGKLRPMLDDASHRTVP